MPDFDLVFEKLEELKSEDAAIETAETSAEELEEIEELRRLSAELTDSEPPIFTTT